MIAFTVLGVPVPKGRPRFRVIQIRGKNTVSTYTDAETRKAEADVLIQAKAHKPRQPLDGPLRVDLLFVVPQPQSLPKGRSARWACVRPDIDNYGKLVLDALNGMFWHDDGQICELRLTKQYGANPRTEIRISILGDADESQAPLFGG